MLPLGFKFSMSKSTGVRWTLFWEEYRQTNLNIWSAGTDGRHSQRDPSDKKNSCHPLFPQDCGMDIDSGEFQPRRVNFDSMLDLFL